MRRPSLDLLRGTAAIAVAIPHLILVTRPNNPVLEGVAILGVEVFFVLSGYVLAPQILLCFRNLSQIPTFLARRWLRTIPPYVLALVCATFVVGELGTADFYRYLVYCQNFFKQSNLVDYYPVAWSLSVEEWFYIIFPAVLLIARPFVSPSAKNLVLLGLAFILIITVIRQSLGDSSHWGSDVRRVVLFRVDAIAYGVILRALNVRVNRTHAVLLPFIAAAALSADLWVIGTRATLHWLFSPLAAAFGISLILLAENFDKRITSSSLLSSASFYLGRISYSLYLFHAIFAALLIDRMMALPASMRIALVLAATISYCTVFYEFFEKPILAARPSYQPEPGRCTAVASGQHQEVEATRPLASDNWALQRD
ncbi:acyltransferase family protein [Bradyrhizobium sp. WSM471]|uniref:acyltransferase family protein n=1 Tax=Bradyrhizobium sp. WSM471 TaxID=319017 RepID=UPI00024D2A8E|nr:MULTISPECIES: acyltransferase [Bradyrhizobium]EHR04607.1 putative acyltransferase [Bradyrhizobium sp. WSM471]UFW39759.1 acyltransferase [Bradyrhizobium canariense]